MVESTLLNKDQDIDEDFDLSDMFESSHGEEMVSEMFGNLVEANRHQLAVAFDLTKLIIDKNPTKNYDEEAVFSVFSRAFKMISDSLPLKGFLEK